MHVTDAVGLVAKGESASERGSYRCLLDLDRDLADEMELHTRQAARAAAIAVTFEAEPGRIPVGDWLSLAAPGPGLLVLDGVLAVNVRVGDRIVAELLGAGDLIQPPSGEYDEMLACDVGWRMLISGRFALLDRSFSKRVRFWPQITHALLLREARRARSLNVQRAIAAQPRLEVRLALLLWHLAARWGKVEVGGIQLPLPLTHQLLGHLIGAERPSVSHALGRLAQAGLVSGHRDQWHLHGSLHDHLATMIGPDTRRVEQLVTAAASLQPH